MNLDLEAVNVSSPSSNPSEWWLIISSSLDSTLFPSALLLNNSFQFSLSLRTLNQNPPRIFQTRPLFYFSYYTTRSQFLRSLLIHLWKFTWADLICGWFFLEILLKNFLYVHSSLRIVAAAPVFTFVLVWTPFTCISTRADSLPSKTTWNIVYSSHSLPPLSLWIVSMWRVMPCLFNAAYICLVTFPVACEALFFFISASFSIVKLVSFDCLCFVRFLCGSLVRWFTCGSFDFCAYVFVGCFHHRSELLNSSRLSVYNLYLYYFIIYATN